MDEEGFRCEDCCCIDFDDDDEDVSKGDRGIDDDDVAKDRRLPSKWNDVGLRIHTLLPIVALIVLLVVAMVGSCCLLVPVVMLDTAGRPFWKRRIEQEFDDESRTPLLARQCKLRFMISRQTKGDG